MQSSQEVHLKELAQYEDELDDLEYDKQQHPQVLLKAKVFELEEVNAYDLIAEFA